MIYYSELLRNLGIFLLHILKKLLFLFLIFHFHFLPEAEKVLFWGQIFEMEILMDLHV